MQHFTSTVLLPGFLAAFLPACSGGGGGGGEGGAGVSGQGGAAGSGGGSGAAGGGSSLGGPFETVASELLEPQGGTITLTLGGAPRIYIEE